MVPLRPPGTRNQSHHGDFPLFFIDRLLLVAAVLLLLGIASSKFSARLGLPVRPETRLLVDRVFSAGRRDQPRLPALVEFPLIGSMTADDLREFCEIDLQVEGDRTLDEVIRHRLGDDVTPGSLIEIDGFVLSVREVVDGRIEVVGLALPPSVATGDPGPEGESA